MCMLARPVHQPVCPCEEVNISVDFDLFLLKKPNKWNFNDIVLSIISEWSRKHVIGKWRMITIVEVSRKQWKGNVYVCAGQFNRLRAVVDCDLVALYFVRWTVRCWRTFVPVTGVWRTSLHTWTKAKRWWHTACTETQCAPNEHSTCAFSETATWSRSLPVSAEWMWRRQAARLRRCRTPSWQGGVSVRMTTAGVSAMTVPTALCCQPAFSTTPASCCTRPRIAMDTSNQPGIMGLKLIENQRIGGGG